MAQSENLQGQSFGNTNWVKGMAQGWKELDYVPTRVLFTGGPVTGQVVTISFEHLRGGAPAIQCLAGFAPSPNVVITAGPTLSAPADSSYWSYSLTVNLLDKHPGQILFSSRVAAGAHLNGSGLVQFSSQTLQIPQPCTLSGTPDLSIVKTGPALVAPGGTLSSTLNYTNKTGNDAASGVQASIILPATVTYVPGSATGQPVLLGNTLTWDLGVLPAGAGGALSYNVVVNSNAPIGQSFSDTAMIFSAENDANLADNVVSNTTSIVSVSQLQSSRSYQPLTLRMLPGPQFQIQATTLPNRHYRVETSADLIHWTTAQDGIPGDGGLLQWVDASTPSPTARFYRLLLLP